MMPLLTELDSFALPCGIRATVAADVSSAPSKNRPQNNEPIHIGCHAEIKKAAPVPGGRLISR